MELTMYDFERYIQKDRDDAHAERMWDNKSESFYKRTEKKQKQFANDFVFHLIKDRQLLKENSKVLDIGCGTGRHLSEFAAYTPYLTGIDISSKMLAYAQEKLRHIPQAKLIHGNWMDTFTTENQFDFVFACMTPAIASIDNIKRMCMISKKYCILERTVYEKDSIEEEIEQLLGRKLFRLPHNDKNYVYGVWNILWLMGYCPEVLVDKQVRTTSHSIEDYMHGTEYNDEEKPAVIQLLNTKAQDGIITAEESVVKAIILWDTETKLKG